MSTRAEPSTATTLAAFGLVLLLPGLTLLGAQLGEIAALRGETEGRIVAMPGSQRRGPVQHAYTVQGREHRSDRILPAQGWWLRVAGVRAQLRLEHQVGDPIRVYYDPERPGERSVLRREPSAAAAGLSMLGLALLLGAAGGRIAHRIPREVLTRGVAPGLALTGFGLAVGFTTLSAQAAGWLPHWVAGLGLGCWLTVTSARGAARMRSTSRASRLGAGCVLAGFTCLVAASLSLLWPPLRWIAGELGASPSAPYVYTSAFLLGGAGAAAGLGAALIAVGAAALGNRK